MQMYIFGDVKLLPRLSREWTDTQIMSVPEDIQWVWHEKSESVFGGVWGNCELDPCANSWPDIGNAKHLISLSSHRIQNDG
jgi:hypothetical protein